MRRTRHRAPAATGTRRTTPWTITASGATGTGGFSTSNYAITYNTGTLTINRRSLSVLGASGDKNYDGTTAVGAGFVLGSDALTTGPSGLADLVTYSGTSAYTNANAGNRTISTTGISITGGADAANYTLLSATATNAATIGVRAITILASNQTQTYGDGNSLTAGYTLSSGTLASGDAISSVSYATNATSSTSGNWNATNGTPWTITASGATGTGPLIDAVRTLHSANLLNLNKLLAAS